MAIMNIIINAGDCKNHAYMALNLVNEGKYLNDGTLRLIAILSQLQSKQSFLLFDEIVYQQLVGIANDSHRSLRNP